MKKERLSFGLASDIIHSMNENNGLIEIGLTQSQILNLVYDSEVIRDEEAGDKMATAWSALAEMRLA